jgi:hypothetical protein
MGKDIQPVTFEMVSELWHGLEESKHWGKLAWAHQCIARPECVAVGESRADGGELFAVLDMNECRVLSEEEFPGMYLANPQLWRDVLPAADIA